MKSKSTIIFWAGLVFSYFLTRLVNLKLIPIFTDEAIYTYWAQVALNDPAQRFISLQDGKQPLFIWLAAIMQKVVSDPLIGSRLVSVFAGFGSIIGIYLLAKELFRASENPVMQSVNKQEIAKRRKREPRSIDRGNLFSEKVAKIAAFLYLILPFTLLYDKLSLFDSLLTMFGIYAVLLTVKMIKELKLDLALLNGLTIGAALITKSSGSFFLYLLPFSLILFDFSKKDWKQKVTRWIGFSALTFVIAQSIYNSLRLSPLFYIIERKNYEFIRPLSEVIKDPSLHLYSNAQSLLGWLITYIGIFLFIIFLSATFYGISQKDRRIFYLLLLFLVPFIAESLFNQILYPRFILFYLPPAILAVSWGFVSFMGVSTKWNKILIFIFAASIVIPVVKSFFILTNPPISKIPQSDSNQYFNDWPAGYGVNEVVEIIDKESRDKEVYIGTQGTFGLFPYALNIYFRENKNVHIFSYWPVDPEILPSEIMGYAKANKTYFVFNENQKEIKNPNLSLIAKYQKGIGESYMRLYAINPVQ